MKPIEVWAGDWKKANLDDDTRRLIGQALWDLWYGPCQEDDFPGFVPACRKIRAALADLPRELWIDGESGAITDAEPETEDGGEWRYLDAVDIVRAIVGKELREYVS